MRGECEKCAAKAKAEAPKREFIGWRLASDYRQFRLPHGVIAIRKDKKGRDYYVRWNGDNSWSQPGGKNNARRFVLDGECETLTAA